ncbi:histone-like nucleoid-structuring protein Lsr2 [Streptomyces sp. NPDC006798]|uniref:Lsr2 family DNA-binding protein n=1 Tax=Streptomyces sp. NPDC006798 TaxID=3155462 RepID=UPI0033D83CBA
MKLTPVIKMEFVSVLGHPYRGLVEIDEEQQRTVEKLFKTYEAAEKNLAEATSKRDEAAAQLIEALGEIGVRPVAEPKTSPADREKIRLWASRNGHEVNPKARIPNIVRAAYENAAAAGKLKDDEKIQ